MARKYLRAQMTASRESLDSLSLSRSGNPQCELGTTACQALQPTAQLLIKERSERQAAKSSEHLAGTSLYIMLLTSARDRVWQTIKEQEPLRGHYFPDMRASIKARVAKLGRQKLRMDHRNLEILL